MSGSKFSKFLRVCSDFEYTHVSLSLTEDLSEMYSFGRQNINRPWIAGFVVEKPNVGMYAIYNSKCEVLSFDVSEEVFSKLQEDIEDMKNNKDIYKYNFVGLLFAYLSIKRDLKHHFTCTQFVAWVLNDVGLDLWEKDISLVYPTDYYDIPNVERGYSGYLNMYNMAS